MGRSLCLSIFDISVSGLRLDGPGSKVLRSVQFGANVPGPCQKDTRWALRPYSPYSDILKQGRTYLFQLLLSGGGANTRRSTGRNNWTRVRVIGCHVFHLYEVHGNMLNYMGGGVHL